MKILAVEDSPQKGTVRKEDVFPLVAGRWWHGEGVRIIPDHPFSDGGSANFPSLLLESAPDTCGGQLLVELDGDGNAGAGG